MKPKAPVRVYLSGPITSLGQERAKKRFDTVAADLRHEGCVPVSPFDNGLPPDAPYEEHMREDLKMLRTCSAICLLRGWNSSPGAKREYGEAVRRHMKIIRVKVFRHRKP